MPKDTVDVQPIFKVYRIKVTYRPHGEKCDKGHETTIGPPRLMSGVKTCAAPIAGIDSELICGSQYFVPMDIHGSAEEELAWILNDEFPAYEMLRIETVTTAHSKEGYTDEVDLLVILRKTGGEK